MFLPNNGGLDPIGDKIFNSFGFGKIWNKVFKPRNKTSRARLKNLGSVDLFISNKKKKEDEVNKK